MARTNALYFLTFVSTLFVVFCSTTPTLSSFICQVPFVAVVLFLNSGTYSAAKTDLYEVLRVSRDASKEDIKKAYRKLSKEKHPDVNQDSDAEERFKEIADAYNVLSADNTRSAYDLHGFEGLEEDSQGMRETSDPFDLFSELLGGGSRRRRSEKQKVQPTNLKLYMSLEQLYNGDVLNVTFSRSVICANADDCEKRRPDCKGPGIRVITQQMGPGFLVQNQIQDDTCVSNGKGWMKDCKACPEGLTQREAVNVSPLVERGAKNGEEIVFEGMGTQELGHENGDLKFTVTEKAHKSFKREENDLRAKFEITLEDALIGFSKNFKHIDNKEVLVKRDTVVHDGEVMTIRGKGMPKKNIPDGYGDLHLVFKIQYPVTLTNKQKELVKLAMKDTVFKSHS